jgi:hypothetical protein
MKTHASLCTGIMGFDLAAFWMGWTNKFMVEKDPFCQKLMNKRFPEVEKYLDLFDFDGSKYRGAIDVLSAGFPCQPFSIAGDRGGSTDDRHLWPQVSRVISEVCPPGLSVKMCLVSLVLNREWLSSRSVLTWKVKATPFKRLLFQLVPLTPHTEGIDSGLLPTMRSSLTGNITENRYQDMVQAKYSSDKRPQYSDILLPTPQARDYRTGEGHRWQTPELRSRNLNDFVAYQENYKLMPTPTAQDGKNSTLPRSQTDRDSVPGALLQGGGNRVYSIPDS